MPEIHVDSLSKRFGSVLALREASFTIRAGEILGLIGPNGSGKTTLFRCVAGVSPPSEGSILVDGVPMTQSRRKQTLYFIPDGIRPWPDQTVDWVLRFSAGIHSIHAWRPHAIAEPLGLTALLGARLRELSKGEHR